MRESRSEDDILSKVDALRRSPDFIWLVDSVLRLNLFSALKLTDYEIRHSTFLAWLLDPSESHGLGGRFACIFLTTLAESAKSQKKVGPDLSKINSPYVGFMTVETEVRSGKNRPDIILRSTKSRFLCVIENKLSSSEHSQQLKRYWDMVQQDYPGKYSKWFVYLTERGSDPSYPKYVALSYADIKSCVDTLLEESKSVISDGARFLIRQYSEALEGRLMGDDKLRETCHRIYEENKKAIDLIIENLPTKDDTVRSGIVKELLSHDLVLDHQTENMVYFTTTVLDDLIPTYDSTWSPEGRVVLFWVEFRERNGLYFALEIGLGCPVKLRDEIVRLTRNQRPFNIGNRQIEYTYTRIYTKRLMSMKEYRSAGPGSIVDTFREKYSSVLQKDILATEGYLVNSKRYLKKVYAPD